MTGVVLACAWIAGSTLAFLYCPPSSDALAFVSLTSALLAGGGSVLLRRRPTLMLSLLAIAIGGLSFARVAFWLPGYAHDPLESWRGEAELRGVVEGDVRVLSQSVRFLVRVDSAGVERVWHSATGGVEVLARSNADVREGDRIELRGTLEAARNQPGYPRADLLRRRGVHDVMEFPLVLQLARGEPGADHWPSRAREALERHIHRWLPEPQASLVGGLLLGRHTSFDPELRAALVATGTTHLVAVSGYNVSLVVALLQMLLIPTAGRRRYWPLALLAIALFTLLVGAPPSAVRAAIMGGLVILAAAVGRLPDALTSLALCAALMIGIDPSLVQDLGFQFSALATLGLVQLAPRLQARLSGLPGWLASPIAVVVSAQLSTVPLALFHFQTLPLAALAANLAAVPLVPLVMASGAALALLGWSDLAGQLILGPAWLVTTLLVELIKVFARITPLSLWFGALPAPVVAAYYLLLGAWLLCTSPTVYSRAPALAGLFASRWYALAGVGSCLALLALVTWPTSDGFLHVRFLESGATLIRGPTGRLVLIGGSGSSPAALAAEVGQRLSFLERSLDLAVLTSADESEALAAVAARYPPQLTLVPSPGLVAAGPSRIAVADLQVELENGAWLRVDRVTDQGIGLRLMFGRVDVLIPATTDERFNPISSGRRVVLRLPRSGAADWDATAMVRRTQPEIVVTALREAPPAVLHTPVYAAGATSVEMITDGEAIWLAEPRCPDANAPLGCIPP